MKFKLGAATAITGWALVEHNLYTQGATHVALYVGSTDDGVTFDTFAAVFGLSTLGADSEPHVCRTFSGLTKRYWRVTITGGASGNAIGGVVLGTGLTLEEAPDAPVADDLTPQMGSARTIGGYEKRQRRGREFVTTSLQWKAGSSDLVDDLEAVRAAQNGAEHPFVYASHDNAFSSAPYAARYVTLERLRSSELSPGGRHRIRMTLEDVPI